MTDPQTPALPYRMYFLSYDTAAHGLFDRTRTAYLVRAAALAELALRGTLVDEEGRARAAQQGRTGDRVLDEVLDQVAGHNRSWKSWIRHGHHETLAAVERRLQEQGELTVEQRRTLAALPGRRVGVADEAAVEKLQEHVSAVLHDAGAADQADPGDAVLAVLAVAGSVRPVVSRREGREHKDRVEELSGRLGDVSPGLERAVRRIGLTIVAARGGMG